MCSVLPGVIHPLQGGSTRVTVVRPTRAVVGLPGRCAVSALHGLFVLEEHDVHQRREHLERASCKRSASERLQDPLPLRDARDALPSLVPVLVGHDRDRSVTMPTRVVPIPAAMTVRARVGEILRDCRAKAMSPCAGNAAVDHPVASGCITRNSLERLSSVTTATTALEHSQRLLLEG
eukprot:scaffold1095_cov63-Phaeocystis_antarctica.AAC.2